MVWRLHNTFQWAIGRKSISFLSLCYFLYSLGLQYVTASFISHVCMRNNHAKKNINLFIQAYFNFLLQFLLLDQNFWYTTLTYKCEKSPSYELRCILATCCNRAWKSDNFRKHSSKSGDFGSLKKLKTSSTKFNLVVYTKLSNGWEIVTSS
jgi:hypothetical protein